MAKRRTFSAAFKARVAKEALRGDRTVQQIAARHGVRPNQVSQWKRKASEGLVELFERGAKIGPDEREAEIRKLHEKIGQLVIERDLIDHLNGWVPARIEAPSGDSAIPEAFSRNKTLSDASLALRNSGAIAICSRVRRRATPVGELGRDRRRTAISPTGRRSPSRELPS